METVRLGKLPDRVPVKLAIMVTPQINDDLILYAALYRDTYGSEEAVIDLTPAMLAAFLEADRAFARSKSKRL